MFMILPFRSGSLSILLESYCNGLILLYDMFFRPLSILLESYCNATLSLLSRTVPAPFNSPRVLLQP
ncbi:protein of unknown function [Thermococcus nautili]|nr:protein of unknown function [Thermococcus nautili]